MSTSVIENQIKEKISKINIDERTLIVLKGIPLSSVDSSIGKISLDQVIENKMGYFMSIFGNRSYISYEEFLLLADFVVAQYKEIYIFDNNIYMKQYPVEDCFSKEIKEGLLAHFEESEIDENDDTYIGDIEEYISIFEGLKEYNGYLIGAYSEPVALLSNKIIHIDIFDVKKEEIILVQSDDILECDLIEESDYIDCVKRIFSAPEKLYIRVSNYTGDINRLKDHISLIAYYWKDYTDIYYVQIQAIENEFVHKSEYNNILKKYWGYDSYRNLLVYDMRKLV